MILHLILQLLSSFAEDTVATLLVIPAFVEEIKGLCVTVRRPSVHLYVRQQYLPTPPTLLMLESSNNITMHGTTIHTYVANVFEVFIHLCKTK